MERKISRYDLPLKPPEGMLSWLIAGKRLGTGKMCYKMEYYQDADGKNRRGVRCTCTECEESFYAGHVPRQHSFSSYFSPYGWKDPADGRTVHDGDACKCPVCGEIVTARYIGKYSGDALKLSSCNVITVERVNGHIAVVSWNAEQLLLYSGRIEYSIYPWEAYIFVGRRCIKNTAYDTSGFYNKRYYVGEWLERSKCVDTLGCVESNDIYPFPASEFDGTELENAKFDIYINDGSDVFPVSYLRLYQRHRAVENFVMNGDLRIIRNLLTAKDYRSCVGSLTDSDKMIDWKARKPAAMLGLTKPEYKALKGRSLSDIKLYTQTKAYGITLENMDELFRRHSNYTLRTLATDFNENIVRAERYIIKQNKKYKNNATFNLLIDYWKMAEPAGRLRDMDVRYPQNLRHAHDELVRLNKWKEDAELNKKFEKRYKELSIYGYSNDMLLIRPCRNEAELINEGKSLEHCVATYARRHASGNTSIFFIRRVTEPEEPFYTLEFSGGVIVQDHGYRNKLQTDEIKEFEKEWLDHIGGINSNGQAERRAS